VTQVRAAKYPPIVADRLIASDLSTISKLHFEFRSTTARTNFGDNDMRRTLIALTAMIVAFIVAIPNAWAGSPHFIQNATSASVSGSTLTVTAKEAGLGDEAQIHVVLTATALCINNGGNHPKAVNKASVSAAADEPVQNGKADYTISVTATFQPSCDPPMTVSFTDIVLTDETNGLTANIPGTLP
jgi:hypothetical protein